MLRTIEKLQQRVRELDQKVKRSLSYEGYDFAAAEDRDLLEEAIKALRGPPIFSVPAGFVFDTQLRAEGYVEWPAS
mgnify:CR=1 FL=1